jgi:hypothetical protein
MNYLDVMSESLAAKLARGEVGRPVALRLYLQLSSDHGLILPHCAAGTRLAEQLFGARADILHAQGGVASGYVSVLARCGAGTALIHSEVAWPKAPAAYLRLLLVGESGSIEFEDSPGDLGRSADLAAPDWAGLQQIAERIQGALSGVGRGA